MQEACKCLANCVIICSTEQAFLRNAQESSETGRRVTIARQLLEELEKIYPSLSKGHKRIADYVRQHYDKAAFFTAAALGEQIKVSESTVVRFAAELGFDGYPSFQRHLQEMVKSRLTSVQRMEVANTRFAEADVVDMALTADIEMIRVTREQVSREAFAASVDALLGAKRIYVIGMRSAAALAGFAAFYLNLIFDRVHLINTSSASEVFEQIFRITKEDACIAISFPRYSRQTLQALHYIAEQGAKVIAITDNEDSPLAPFATHLLTAKSNMVSFVDSLTAPLSLINALLAAAAKRTQVQVYQNLQTLENIWDEYQVYHTNSADESVGKD